MRSIRAYLWSVLCVSFRVTVMVAASRPQPHAHAQQHAHAHVHVHVHVVVEVVSRAARSLLIWVRRTYDLVYSVRSTYKVDVTPPSDLATKSFTTLILTDSHSLLTRRSSGGLSSSRIILQGPSMLRCMAIGHRNLVRPPFWAGQRPSHFEQSVRSSQRMARHVGSVHRVPKRVVAMRKMLGPCAPVCVPLGRVRVGG